VVAKAMACTANVDKHMARVLLPVAAVRPPMGKGLIGRRVHVADEARSGTTR